MLIIKKYIIIRNSREVKYRNGNVMEKICGIDEDRAMDIQLYIKRPIARALQL